MKEPGKKSGDTLESIRETARLARALKPQFASFNIATPDPGTPLFEELKDRLALETFESFDRLNTNFSMCGIPPKQLRKELIRAYLLFYARPTYWLTVLRYILKDPLRAPVMFKIFYRQAMNVLS